MKHFLVGHNHDNLGLRGDLSNEALVSGPLPEQLAIHLSK